MIKNKEIKTEFDNTKAKPSKVKDYIPSNFIVKVDDLFCEWEFGFTIDSASIEDFIEAIEKNMRIKRKYEKLSRSYFNG